MLSYFFKTHFRQLQKNKTGSLLNILGLATGIACAGLIFLWVGNEMTYDNQNLKKDRLYDVRVNASMAGRPFTMGSTLRGMARALREEVPGIVNTARISDQDQNILIGTGDRSLYSMGRYADPSLFSMLTLPFVEGNPRSAFTQLYSLVITEQAAKKFFGTTRSVVGKTLRVDNMQDYTVTGVIQDLPENSSLRFDWLAPYELTNRSHSQPDWEGYGPLTYVELAPNADLAAINRRMKGFIQEHRPEQTKTCFLYPMSRWHLYDQFAGGQPTGGGRIQTVRLLSYIAWIILLIACINFMNLATAQSQQRAKEIGVRKVLGALKGRLVTRFLGEALFLSTLAAVAALGIMAIALPAFNSLVGQQLTLNLANPFHWIGLATLVLVCGLVAGSYPALYLSSFNPILVLKGLTIRAGGDAWVRKGLVVLQFSVSIVFIIATIVVYRQLQYVQDRDLGFDRRGVVQIVPQHDISRQFTVIRQDLLNTGVVDQVAMADHPPLYGGDTDDRFDWEGKSPDIRMLTAKRNVTPGFITTYGMHLVSGRDFDAGGQDSGSQNILINQSFARLLGGNPLGRIIRLPSFPEGAPADNFTVIGVVGDFVYANMYEQPQPVVFFCKPPQKWFTQLIYVRFRPDANPHQALSKMESVMRADNPSYPFKYAFVDDQFNRLFQNEQQTGRLARLFAVLAVLISSLGLFGLAAYTAERRVREIGIRKVLGASVWGITGLLSKDFLSLVAFSCLLAFPVAAWIMHDWLAGYAYRIGLSPWVFLIAGALALVIAFFTISFQTLRAALGNPVKSLRAE